MPKFAFHSQYTLQVITLWSSCIILTETACPDGWTEAPPDRCHKVIYQSTEFTNVKEARGLCQQEGADLGTIRGNDDQDIITDLVLKLNVVVNQVYIGAMDTLGNGTYTWLDNMTDFTNDTFADAYDSSNIRHLADRCVALYSSNGTWKDVVWIRVPCCFKHSVNTVACTKPNNTNVTVTFDEVANYCFGDCPTESYRLNDQCYKVNEGVYSYNATYWARVSCMADGYDLANVLPGLVFDHVLSMLRDKDVPTDRLIYTGLNNLTTQYVFVTTAGQTYAPSPLINVDTCSYDSATDKCIFLKATVDAWNVSDTQYCPQDCCLDVGSEYSICERSMAARVTPTTRDTDPFAQTCDPGADYCESSPCQHGANCTTYTNHYVCECLPGYEGINCEIDIDECENVTCNNGGTCIDGVNKATCNCTAAYMGDFCDIAILCPSLSGNEVSNATISNDGSGRGGDTVTFTCLEGMLLPDRSPNVTLVCVAPGKWEPREDELGNCEYHCPALPDVANADVDNPSSAYGSEVNFICREGYLFPNNETRMNTTCLNTGQWTKSDIPDCEIITCPQLPFWEHQQTDTRNNTYNTTVTLWCDVGYELWDHTVARTIKCTSDGEWTVPLPPCQPVECPQIDIPADWYITRDTDDYTYGTYVTYTCQDDKRMLDGATFREIKCDATGEWSDNITDCSSDRCFPLPFVANATPSTLDAEFGTITVLTCIKGHRFLEKYLSMKMSCNTDGWWRPILSSCEPILCPELVDVQNTVRSTDSRLYDTIVNYTCIKGHYYYPNMTSVVSIQCLDSEQWNNTDLEPCWPVVCSQPPDISNGSRRLPADNNFNYSAQVYYECLTGFKFIDGSVQKTIECNEFGKWNVSDVSCRVDRCSPVPMAANVVPDTTNTSWYTNVTYTCQRGYEWPAGKISHHITCQNDGKWNDTNIPPCTIKECTPVERMPNATTNTTDHVYNTFVDYQCDVGFKYPDNETSKIRWCSDMALWEPPEFPECEIIYCPELEDVENATRDSNDTYYNNHVTYSCLPGYQFPDKTKMVTIYCTANATWTDTPLPCEVVFCPPVPWWTETKFNSTLNEFNAEVAYWCSEGYVFEDSFNEPDTIKYSVCTHAKVWEPPIDDCLAKESIDADLRGVTYESPNSVSIGTIACSVTVTALCCMILLDTKKLYNDMKMMKKNVSSFIREMKAKNSRRNKVSDSTVNINNSTDSA